MSDELKIEWEGLKEFSDLLKKTNRQITKIVMEKYTDLGVLAEEGTKALAPHDEGNLEDSINFDSAKKQGGNIIVQGGSNLEYALRRHEEPYRMGVHDKYGDGRKTPDYYVGGRGRATHRKPPWRGYKPGRKYLDNAIKGIEKDYDSTNIRILEKILGTE